MLRLSTIAAGRDIGENVDAFRDPAGSVVADPPHRGLGRLRLLRALEQRTPALSRAVTETTSAVERVDGLERRAAIARADLAAARQGLPAPPAQGDFGRLLWLAMVATFAAIEGIATRALWAEVTDDKRLGLIFAVVFAIVFTASVHVLATWLWGLAADFDRLRGVTMAIVVAMLVCAGGLLLVAGFERDKILIANLDKERAQLELRRGGSAAGQSLITGSIPATDPAARGGAGAAPSSSPAAPAAGSAPATGGLLGALGASPAPGAATGGQAAPGAVPGAGSGGLAGAVPGATTPAVPRASRTTVDSEDDVSFRFVIWLNMLVLLAMLLFTRGRTLGGGYRRARRRVERLEKCDGKVRKQLAGAEAKRHDTSAKVDYCQRVLFPIAQRCASEEERLDRLFVDQIARSALAAGHGRVDVVRHPPPPIPWRP